MIDRRSFLALASAGSALANKVSLPTRSVKVIRAFDSPCPHPNGLEATDEGLWILNQGGDNALYLTDYHGKLLEKLETESVSGSGVGWDGTNLWIASTYNCKILKVDRKTGKTLASYDTPGCGKVNWPNPRRSPLAAKVVETKPGAPPAAPPKRETQGTGAHGIEYKNGKLYIAVPPAQKIYTVRASDFHVESEFATAGDRPHGLGWEGAHLWCADSNQNAFHKHELPGGRVLAKIQLTDSDPLPHGMAIRKGWMWYCDDVGVVCKLKM